MQTEQDVLKWLAHEYGLAYTTLEDVEPDKQLLSLFPARILLKEELLPLRRLNGTVEVATSRLFATQGLDALKSLTGLNLKPVLASSEAIQREMKKRLGVGAATIDTLGEEASFQVVDENPEEDRSGKRQNKFVFSYDERRGERWCENPYALAQHGDGRQEMSGTFWLLPYWMGRYYGILKE